ncbi:uncharacterized protein HD556DRAFT_1307186 [Suillus plorans]|uniref:Uncharacterized protein n=1 Tax=Suillus plorans TaxID=116603 RepID=A0A9P7ASW1_9AGAM|nr:uncharacterized protein HD556DRAFT_1307186 [Suillus plorans]KAG1795959.1 hypothetical protein HD556DRAFT_1307186 [Suillus plorans]
MSKCTASESHGDEPIPKRVRLISHSDCRMMFINANSQESDLQSVISQDREHQEILEHSQANAFTILNENHQKELAESQAKNLSPHTNIVGFLIIPDVNSDSDGDKGSEPPLTSLLANIPIQNATVSMLIEALTKVLILLQTTSPRAAQLKHKSHEPPTENFTDVQRQNNKANVWELFYMVFNFVKDDKYMLHVTALCKAILSFMRGLGTGPDHLKLHWDMMTTHKSQWNQKVIDILCTQYTYMFEKSQLVSRSCQPIIDDITKKFHQCRSSWRKAQPCMLSDGARETMQEVGDQLVNQTNK